jgi:ABC-type nitrate/sulfonate/bicarbonate transport system substrate-binding protein
MSGTIHYSRCHVPTPLGIASQRGWLVEEAARHGYDLLALRDVDDPAVRRSHYDHSQNDSIRQGGSTPAIWARSIGADTKVIGLTWTDEFQAIIALEASGIRTAADLRGRRLGLPTRRNDDIIDFGRAQAERGFHGALATAGLTPADAQFVAIDLATGILDDPNSATRHRTANTGNGGDLGSSAVIHEALRSRQVDAIYIKGGSGRVLERLGAVVVTDLGNHPNPLIRANNCTPRPITVDGHFLRTKPDLVVALLARAVAAGTWAAADPLAGRASVSAETGVAIEALDRAYGPDLATHLRVELEPATIAGFADYIAFLHRTGYLPNQVDVDSWIDPAPLAAVRESRLAGAAR